MTVVHHTAICTRDVDESLRFWRDGLGFAIVMDHTFEGDWATLFDAPSRELRAVFLADPAIPDAGIIELVEFPAGVADGSQQRSQPAVGFFLVSCFVDVTATVERLAALGLGGALRRIEQMGVAMAVVRDPNGVLVELIDARTAQR